MKKQISKAATSYITMSPKSYTLSLTGDVMLGRLIDQLMPEHVENAHDAASAEKFIEAYPTDLSKGNYTPSSPWSTTLPLLTTSDLTLINLETSVTTSNTPWPDKVFNYRMHPANLAPILHAGGINYAGLANNHTLDFGIKGLRETINTLKEANVAFAGIGESAHEACKPAVLHLSKAGHENEHEVHVYSASDHPRSWESIPGFHFLDYTPETRSRLRTLLSSSKKPALKIFSVHWGPNYKWSPDSKITSLAHFLIDECGVDIVHGHSAHHVQGVEVYKGKLVLYGCGDFVDDYAVNREFRNDLGALWRVFVTEDDDGGLKLDRLEVLPTRVEKFGARLLDRMDGDYEWVRERARGLSGEFGTVVRVGERGEIVVGLGS